MDNTMHEQGVCPKCGGENLSYGTFTTESDQMLYYNWTCDDCEAKGKEWYSFEFVEHTFETE